MRTFQRKPKSNAGFLTLQKNYNYTKKDIKIVRWTGWDLNPWPPALLIMWDTMRFEETQGMCKAGDLPADLPAHVLVIYVR